MPTTPTEGVQTSFGEHASTYPDTWHTDDVPMPGSHTAAPSKEHQNAKEQEYYLQDEAEPVKKGEHVRPQLRAEDTGDGGGA